MGMIMEWVALDPDEAERVRLLPDDQYTEWWIGGGHTRFDVDKTWHGVHAVLTGTAWDADGPLAWAVLGGVELGEDHGYGPARLLSAEQVAQVADALDELGSDGFAAKIDADRLVALEIYPSGIWKHAAPYLTESFDLVRTFYRSAADDGRAVLMVLG